MAKVLIIDDSRTSRKILKSILEENGHEVIAEAKDGKEGVETYMAVRPDITTLDITMPVLDGIEALKQIIHFDPEAVIVMATAAGQKSKIVEAVRTGATEFIQKPFDPDQIKSIIQRLKK